MKKSEKELICKEVCELRYNKGISIKELALHYGKLERTIYRWLRNINNNEFNSEEDKKIKCKRVRKYTISSALGRKNQHFQNLYLLIKAKKGHSLLDVK
ncbi:MAG: hypothetical protein ACTSRP_13265 [Candidatus Helarchaeota archaeon]